MKDEIKKQMEELAADYLMEPDKFPYISTTRGNFKAGFTACHDLMQSRIEELKKEFQCEDGGVSAADLHIIAVTSLDKIRKLEKANRVMLAALKYISHECMHSNQNCPTREEMRSHSKQALSEADKILESK